jgi:hypothetical protein
MTRLVLTLCCVAVCSSSALLAGDIDSLTLDLKTPAITDGPPAPGKRARQFLKEYEGTGIFHALYLPTDWQPGKKYPVVVEYTGNKYRSSLGIVEENDLGFGISAGRGVIWVCVPYVNKKEKKNQPTWWGDVDATVDYCKRTVPLVCEKYGGDASNVFIAGFSRGAIACNFIGLHDDEIASLWRGFICHSHYDGVRQWGYAGSDRASAAERLKRLGKRPQFISHENSVKATQDYLREASPDGNFTFLPLPGVSHTDTWVLRDVPQRKLLRDWFRQSLK